MRTRRPADLRADVLDGHLSSALCHMANVSYRVGHRRSPGEIVRSVQHNDLLAESLGRVQRHLQANEVDLEKDRLTLGPTLTLDLDKEQFVGDASEWANMFLSRNYRRPFVMPDRV